MTKIVNILIFTFLISSSLSLSHCYAFDIENVEVSLEREFSEAYQNYPFDLNLQKEIIKFNQQSFYRLQILYSNTSLQSIKFYFYSPTNLPNPPPLKS